MQNYTADCVKSMTESRIELASKIRKRLPISDIQFARFKLVVHHTKFISQYINALRQGLCPKWDMDQSVNN